MLKLKLGRQNSQAFADGQQAKAQAKAQAQAQAQEQAHAHAHAQAQQNAPSPALSNAPPPTPGGGAGAGAGFKLKLNVSHPPTPIEQSQTSVSIPTTETASTDKKKRSYPKKADGVGKGKKRAADDDNAPAAKRIASGPASAGPSRKISLKPPQTPATDLISEPAIKLKVSNRKKSVPKLLDIRARGKVPPRPKGVGYDSEDSDTEKDPAIQQAFVLRMEDGEDATYLKQAIADGKIGPKPEEGDADVKIKFIEKGYRRAIITIRKRMYAAVLVDLPCIVESMKSFDKKGWWKVADIAQMLLVLGPCNSDEEARAMPLPREIKDSYQYPHGLTPPMRWARKRRFRKRLNYNENLNIEEEVERLIAADKERERAGGRSEMLKLDGRDQRQASEQRSEIEYEEEVDEEGAVDTIEGDGQQYEFNLDAEGEDDAEGDEDLEAKMQAMFDEDVDEGDISQLVAESPAPVADTAASMAGVENAMAEDTDATPAATPMADTQDEQSDDEESDEDDDDSPDVIDEDAAAKAAERAQQLEEVADLEKEVERARQKSNAMTNQLLRQREMQRLAGLEEELATKKRVFGLEDDDE